MYNVLQIPGLKTAFFWADMEGSIMGHKEKRLCPAKDVMRWFRYGYPAVRRRRMNQRSDSKGSKEASKGANGGSTDSALLYENETGEAYGGDLTSCVLGLTIDPRTAQYSMDDVRDFVTEEAKINGYAATLIKTFSYGMGCLVFEITEGREPMAEVDGGSYRGSRKASKEEIAMEEFDRAELQRL